MCLVKSTKLREGKGQLKIRSRIIWIRLDRTSTPCNRLLLTPQQVLRQAHVSHPDESRRIARAEAQGLSNVSLCFFGAADIYLAKADSAFGSSEISIQRQRMFAFGDAHSSTLRPYVDKS
jgi:hypothetical protein